MTIFMNLQRGLVGQFVSGKDSIKQNSLRDASGYNNHAGSSTVATDSSGIIDTAVQTDGATQYSASDPIKDAIENAQFSISVWWRQDSHQDSDDWADLIQWRDDSKETTKRLERSNADSSPNSDWWCNFGMNPAQSKGSLSQSDTGVAGGEWFHWLCTVDGSAGEFNVYVNAELAQQSDSEAAEIYRPNTDIRLNANAAEGAFEEVRFYNRILSEREINRLYQMRNQPNRYV